MGTAYACTLFLLNNCTVSPCFANSYNTKLHIYDAVIVIIIVIIMLHFIVTHESSKISQSLSSTCDVTCYPKAQLLCIFAFKLYCCQERNQWAAKDLLDTLGVT